MEVHHHTHTSSPSAGRAGKKWAHYFWEFLMLFFAVFCGFFAEYQLEHRIERDRAKELAVSFYEELQSDSANLGIIIENRKHKEGHLLYLADYFKDSSLSNLPKQFYPSLTFGLFASSYVLFEAKDGILQQLKNSGSLRYFQNADLQKAIGDYSVALNNIRTRIERENLLTSDVNRDFLLNHYDHSWLAKITGEQASANEAVNTYLSGEQVIPARLKNLDNIDREKTENYMRYFRSVIRGTRVTQMSRYQEAVRRLIQLLKREYHLK